MTDKNETTVSEVCSACSTTKQACNCKEVLENDCSCENTDIGPENNNIDVEFKPYFGSFCNGAKQTSTSLVINCLKTIYYTISDVFLHSCILFANFLKQEIKLLRK